MDGSDQPRPAAEDEATLCAGMSRSLVLLLAVACGGAVANLYYAQPLLHTLAQAFAVSNGTAGLLVTVSQIGYVLGLALLVPLGDLRERRGLICMALVVTAAALAVAAAAPGIVVFGAAIAAVGVTSVVAQVIVPMSSSPAAEHERGRVVGTVMSGLLIGILGARTVTGLVAAALGYGNAVIGLAGVAGAGAAPAAGRLADRGHGTLTTSATVVVLLASWGILAAGHTSVIALIIGIAVLDLGVQGLHISNQSAIYALAPEARSRLTTAYMVSVFVGGAVLSAVTASLYGSDGWSGVCVLGAATALLALTVWVATQLSRRTAATAVV